MPPLLEALDICKSFPGVRALDRVHLQVQAGEILAVVGENGAGKSTLMKILGGVYSADSGTIRLEGKPVAISAVKEAEHLGIVLIHQELNLAEQLDVAGNVFLGREPTWGGWLRLVDRSIYVRAAAITGRLGLEASPRTLVSRLPVGQQQLVEIARALSLRSRVLILDEPTSSLTEKETARLFEVLRSLKQEGLAIVYISHRLKEVNDIADRVTVLRDGRNAGELPRQQINHDAIVRLMVGRELKQFFHRVPEHAAPANDQVEKLAGAACLEALLEVRDLRWSPSQKEGISFALRPGEIVGLAGLIGAGRTELAETIFGIRRRLTGDIRLDGRLLKLRRPAQAIAAGIFLIPEDRRLQGLILSDSVKNNTSLPNLDLVQLLGLVRPGRERQLAQMQTERLHVRTPSIDQPVGLLSGGNQQKVVLGKWLCRTPRVLILDEPTRGVDVGAKSEIYALMDELRRSRHTPCAVQDDTQNIAAPNGTRSVPTTTEGVAILMISSDLEEILRMSDRVLVLHQGSLAGELTRGQLSEEAVMRLATGGTS